MKVFVVIPAHNEVRTIKAVVQDVQKFCTNVIVVDDGSTDGTGQEAELTGVEVLRHIVNRGQGAALQTGITWALRQGADIIVTFDADAQHQPATIPDLVKVIFQDRVDVVLGSRFLKPKSNQMPVKKLIMRKLALLHQWFFSGLKVTDNHCGLRAFSRRAAQTIYITQDRMSHASEILDQIARQKLSYQEIPVQVQDTVYSLAKTQRGITGSLRIIYDFFIARLVR